jgi:hypothetical protein
MVEGGSSATVGKASHGRWKLSSNACSIFVCESLMLLLGASN